MLSSKVLEKGRICQEQLEEVVSMALESLKTLMVDCETPIEIRLQVALRLFENFGTDSRKNSEELLIRGVENNARNIKRNAHQLLGIETLLKQALQTKHEALYQNETYSVGDFSPISVRR